MLKTATSPVPRCLRIAAGNYRLAADSPGVHAGRIRFGWTAPWIWTATRVGRFVRQADMVAVNMFSRHVASGAIITRTRVSSNDFVVNVRQAVLFEARPGLRLPPMVPTLRVGLAQPIFALAAKIHHAGKMSGGAFGRRPSMTRPMGRITRHPLEDYGLRRIINFALLQASRYQPVLNPKTNLPATMPVYLCRPWRICAGRKMPGPIPSSIRKNWSSCWINWRYVGAMVDRFADLGAHGIFMFDDWGLQDRLMLAPDVFRRS